MIKQDNLTKNKSFYFTTFVQKSHHTSSMLITLYMLVKYKYTNSLEKKC